MRFYILVSFLFSLLLSTAHAADPEVICDVTADAGHEDKATFFCNMFKVSLPDDCKARLFGKLVESSNGHALHFEHRMLVIRINGNVCGLNGMDAGSSLLNQLVADFSMAPLIAQECGRLYCNAASPLPPPNKAEIDAAVRDCNVKVGENVDDRLPEAVCADLDTAFRRVDPTCSYDVDMRFNYYRDTGQVYASSVRVAVGDRVCEPLDYSVQSIMNPYNPDFAAIGAIGGQCAQQLCALSHKD